MLYDVHGSKHRMVEDDNGDPFSNSVIQCIVVS